MTDDSTQLGVPGRVASRTVAGFGLAVLAGLSFGLSGALGRGLHDAGWSPAATVSVRILGAFLVLVVPGIRALDGRWYLLRRNLGRLIGFGVLGVAATQVCYFYAITYMSVGVALLIEYLSPIVVIGWLWARYGQRPSRLTAVGAAVAIIGLVLVLNVLSGASLSLVGVAWALAAMAGGTAYFLLAAGGDEQNELPPLALAAAGMLVGGVVLLILGLLGVMPLTAGAGQAVYDGHTVPIWLPLLLLAVVTAAVPYASGVAAVRLLGSRLTSFVMLTEVLFAVLFAWLLLAEVPGPMQIAGGLVVLVGVVLVKLGEQEITEAA